MGDLVLNRNSFIIPNAFSLNHEILYRGVLVQWSG